MTVMTLFERVKTQVKAGRHNNRFAEYKQLYEEITGKTYASGCSGCACKYLYRFLQGWYENNKI